MNETRKKVMRLYVTLTDEERGELKAQAARQQRKFHEIVTDALRQWLTAQTGA